MRARLVLLAFAVPMLAGVSSREAHATGGLVTTAADAGVVTAREHRVILSVTDEQTSLWDDLAYTGEPGDLAWILPVQGPAEIAESSVYLQQHLDGMTPVTVSAVFCCPAYPHCNDSVFDQEGHGAVIADHPVAEPYETVRIASADAGALPEWLAAGGYVLTDAVAAVLDDYAAQGFDFLAVRFAPDAGVTDTRPLRVTMPGRHPVLPIPMLRAGAADRIDTTLWIVADAFHLPPTWFQVGGDALTWDWDTRTSDYDAIVADRRAAAGDGAWLLEAVALPYESDMDAIALETADHRGSEEERSAAAEADLEALVGPLVAAGAPIHVTRLSAQVAPGEGLVDVELAPSALEPFEQPWADSFVGDFPCPPTSGAGAPPGGASTGGSGGAAPGEGGAGGAGDADGASASPHAGGDEGCSLGAASGGGGVGSLLALLVAVAAHARRRRSS